MLKEQVTGLADEVKELCVMLQIPNPADTEMCGKAYNEVVKTACKLRDESMMKKEIEKMKEKRIVHYQNFDVKEYVRIGTLFTARKTWEVRNHLLNAAVNMLGQTKYEAPSWKCKACNMEVQEDQEHLTKCAGYEDLHNSAADLGNEVELVEFFSRAMGRRREKNWD